MRALISKWIMIGAAAPLVGFAIIMGKIKNKLDLD